MTARRGPRYGLVADVHANLQALEAVLAQLDEESVDAIWCLGDVVGYGGDPAACLAAIRDRCAVTVLGNHDLAAADPVGRNRFNAQARAAIERHVELLDATDIAWLAALPATVSEGDATLTHSGLADPAAFTYVTDARLATVELEAQRTPWGFFGHTHVPVAYAAPPDGPVIAIRLSEGEPLSLAGPTRWFLNPGAVGQPRDRDPRAAYAILDIGAETYVQRRVPYDIAAAQESIRRRGLPLIEADRLAVGR
ncbi:MAG: metallophosphoesterase [Gemmatimonadota bacterium]